MGACVCVGGLIYVSIEFGSTWMACYHMGAIRSLELANTSSAAAAATFYGCKCFMASSSSSSSSSFSFFFFFFVLYYSLEDVRGIKSCEWNNNWWPSLSRFWSTIGTNRPPLECHRAHNTVNTCPPPIPLWLAFRISIAFYGRSSSSNQLELKIEILRVNFMCFSLWVINRLLYQLHSCTCRFK